MKECEKFEFAVKFCVEGFIVKISGVFTIHIAPVTQQPLTLTPASGALPDETVGTVAAGNIAISGGTPPYSLTPVTGLPPGVTAALSADGTQVVFSGIPTTAGDASFTVEVTDSGA